MITMASVHQAGIDRVTEDSSVEEIQAFLKQEQGVCPNCRSMARRHGNGDAMCREHSATADRLLKRSSVPQKTATPDGVLYAEGRGKSHIVTLGDDGMYRAPHAQRMFRWSHHYVTDAPTHEVCETCVRMSKTASRKRADAGTWTATATAPDAKGKSTLTVTGPDGVTMGESGKRAGAATHVVVRHNNPEADNGYWLNRNGHPYGYSIHGNADAAAKEADRARGDRQVGSGIPLSHQVWLVPVEHSV